MASLMTIFWRFSYLTWMLIICNYFLHLTNCLYFYGFVENPTGNVANNTAAMCQFIKTDQSCLYSQTKLLRR